jgi:hypothetical protein
MDMWSWADGFPVEFCNRVAALLAVFVGVVAVGAERRMKWVAPFTGNLFGSGQRRVRGYLRPVDPPGVHSARPAIGLENVGLARVRVGIDAPLPECAREAIVEFTGTKDGSPPSVTVLKGSVTIAGGPPDEERPLKDGDVIEIEGLKYQYLRGKRK